MKQKATMAVTGNLRCRSVKFGETGTVGGVITASWHTPP